MTKIVYELSPKIHFIIKWILSGFIFLTSDWLKYWNVNENAHIKCKILMILLPKISYEELLKNSSNSNSFEEIRILINNFFKLQWKIKFLNSLLPKHNS